LMNAAAFASVAWRVWSGHAFHGMRAARRYARSAGVGGALSELTTPCPGWTRSLGRFRTIRRRGSLGP
jgi:hypothetical protein